MTEKTIKKVCSCTNCGNEAEMAVTCTLESVAKKAPAAAAASGTKIKGHGVCTSCGSEADMWLDLEEVTGV
ncbi:MAG: hypothetical protein ABIL58_26445 [Pseudomonadota bacterium]